MRESIFPNDVRIVGYIAFFTLIFILCIVVIIASITKPETIPQLHLYSNRTDATVLSCMLGKC